MWLDTVLNKQGLRTRSFAVLKRWIKYPAVLLSFSVDAVWYHAAASNHGGINPQIGEQP
jgi:hypothetical protein